ncbi:hypothetical protein CVT26_003523 [Gymnopilus dilepis]|uniref:Protein EFR3 n=1 Tax=Gymnopilus dilepis TaxID=231916 RepID=A0A409WR32_9AGAR|nr:hypothetical protein CVT26_003523 [Gymnopilus dilepis]
MHLFTPNHVKLLNSCYPPTSTLLTAGPDYSPNSHELSRLTYYASNNPGKLAKIGGELEKRLKLECRKARSGNIRSRASLLISLSIFRSLATECRRDIALLSPSLIGSVNFTLSLITSDLEVIARAASVFTAWTTYTNGHLIGTDSNVTSDYLTILKQFARHGSLSSSDQETQNRTRLIGLAALTAAINSEALYNDISHFGSQVEVILRPILMIIFDTPISTLNDQSSSVKEGSSSPYLAEFRTRPALERRAASIHIHIDGDKGPSMSDVSDASLHALFSLSSHANGAQLGYIMKSSFNNLNTLGYWANLEHCCWYAEKIAEWAQYQYRYVIPTWLVDSLLAHQGPPTSFTLLKTLTVMVTTVFRSSTPLINLSSSDIISNLLTLLLRYITYSPDDSTLAALVECISSLGCHVYYSDQIQDLAAELVNRIMLIEMQGLSAHDTASSSSSRSLAIRCILQALMGLIRAANASDPIEPPGKYRTPDSPTLNPDERASSPLDKARSEKAEGRLSRRTQVAPDIWQDILTLLCDPDPLVRNECASALVCYISEEMPRKGEIGDIDCMKHFRRLPDMSLRHVQGILPNITDPASKFLNSLHAYLFILALSPTLDPLAKESNLFTQGDPPIRVVSSMDSDDHHGSEEVASLPQSTNRRASIAQYGPKARKEALVLHLLEQAPSRLSTPPKASEEDYANILKVLTTIQLNVPMHGLLTGIPMLSALSTIVEVEGADPTLLQRIVTIKTVVAHVLITIGRVWKIQELVSEAEKVQKPILVIPGVLMIFVKSSKALSTPKNVATLHTSAIDFDHALSLIVSCRLVQEAFGLDEEGMRRRLSIKWTPQVALREFSNSTGYDATLRGDGISPLLKISPALMQIENISLQSLARSTRGLGVTDLREALEGRSSMSNPALVRPPSVSTLDHASSSFMVGEGHLRLTQTRSRTRTKKRPAQNNEVKDVLTRLGISKQSSNLLKATFPALQKSSQ